MRRLSRAVLMTGSAFDLQEEQVALAKGNGSLQYPSDLRQVKIYSWGQELQELY